MEHGGHLGDVQLHLLRQEPRDRITNTGDVIVLHRAKEKKIGPPKSQSTNRVSVLTVRSSLFPNVWMVQPLEEVGVSDMVRMFVVKDDKHAIFR